MLNKHLKMLKPLNILAKWTQWSYQTNSPIKKHIIFKNIVTASGRIRTQNLSIMNLLQGNYKDIPAYDYSTLWLAIQYFAANQSAKKQA